MEMSYNGEYLSCDHTLEWYKKEPYYPSKVIDREMLHAWQAKGRLDANEHAKEIVAYKLAQPPKQILSDDIIGKLDMTWKEIEAQSKVCRPQRRLREHE